MQMSINANFNLILYLCAIVYRVCGLIRTWPQNWVRSFSKPKAKTKPNTV